MHKKFIYRCPLMCAMCRYDEFTKQNHLQSCAMLVLPSSVATVGMLVYYNLPSCDSLAEEACPRETACRE